MASDPGRSHAGFRLVPPGDGRSCVARTCRQCPPGFPHRMDDAPGMSLRKRMETCPVHPELPKAHSLSEVRLARPQQRPLREALTDGPRRSRLPPSGGPRPSGLRRLDPAAWRNGAFRCAPRDRWTGREPEQQCRRLGGGGEQHPGPDPFAVRVLTIAGISMRQRTAPADLESSWLGWQGRFVCRHRRRTPAQATVPQPETWIIAAAPVAAGARIILYWDHVATVEQERRSREDMLPCRV